MNASSDRDSGQAPGVKRRSVSSPALMLSAFAAALLLHTALLCALISAAKQFGSVPNAEDSAHAAAPKASASPQKVTARQLSKSEWHKNRSKKNPTRRAEADTPPKKPDEKQPDDAQKQPPRKPEKLPHGKVVAVADGNGMKAKDAQFLSETDNAVEKETVSRHRRQDYAVRANLPTFIASSNARNAPKISAQTAAPSQTPANAEKPPLTPPQPVPSDAVAQANASGDGEKTGEGTELTEGSELTKEAASEAGNADKRENAAGQATWGDDAPKRTADSASTRQLWPTEFEGLSDVPARFRVAAQGKIPPSDAHGGSSGEALRENENNGAQGNTAGGQTHHGTGGAPGGAQALRTLTPSSGFLAQFVGGPASDLSSKDGVPEDEGTYLNTRTWKHAGFFNRIKDVVGSHWNPQAVIALKDPDGKAYLYKDRATQVSVTLDSHGKVKDVQVTHSSGVEFLDKEALEAFRRADAFPHPPTALQNDRGEITFSFGFYIETDKAALRLFR